MPLYNLVHIQFIFRKLFANGISQAVRQILNAVGVDGDRERERESTTYIILIKKIFGDRPQTSYIPVKLISIQNSFEFK